MFRPCVAVIPVLLLGGILVANRIFQRDDASQSEPKRNGETVNVHLPDEALRSVPGGADVDPASNQLEVLRSRIADIRASKTGIDKPQAILEYLAEAYSGVFNEHLSEFFEILGQELEPDQALTIQLPLVSKLLRLDPEAAESLLKSLGSSGADLRILEITARNLNAAVAERLLATLDGAKRRAVAYGYSIVRASVDLDSAIEIAGSIPPQYQNDVYERIADTAARNSNDYQQLLIKFLKMESGIGVDVTSNVIRAWSKSDPEAVAGVLAQTWTGGGEREKNEERLTRWTQELVRNWTEIDLQAASGWLVANQDIPGWDQGAEEVVKELMATSENEALAWANAIKNDRMRMEKLTTVFNLWSSNDSSSALEALRKVASKAEMDVILKGTGGN